MSEDNITVDNSKELTIKNQKPLFTHEERESVVRAFIEAWNTHRVWLEFPKSTIEKSNDPVIDLLILSSISATEPTEENIEARKTLRKRMDNNIKIVSGSVPSTPEIIYEGVDVLYNDIVDLQGHGLLGGSFLTNQNEDRIFDRVMKKVDMHIDKVREELGLNDV